MQELVCSQESEQELNFALRGPIDHYGWSPMIWILKPLQKLIWLNAIRFQKIIMVRPSSLISFLILIFYINITENQPPSVLKSDKSPQMGNGKRLKCTWTFHPRHSSKVTVSIETKKTKKFARKQANYGQQVVLRFIRAAFPRTKRCLGSKLRFVWPPSSFFKSGLAWLHIFTFTFRIFNSVPTTEPSPLNYPGYYASCGVSSLPPTITRLSISMG